MKVKLIEEQAQKFQVYLEQAQDYPEMYKYENLHNFRANWDIEADDFYTMFDESFKSRISNSLWGGSVNSAKSVMLLFIENNPEYVRSMFRDLFNEDKDLSLRVNRFSFHCDEMMEQLGNSRSKPVSHKHNPAVLTVYLCFNDPTLYTIVQYPSFVRVMKLLENQDVPHEFELERIFKLCRGLYKILSRNEALLAQHQSLVPEPYRCENNMLILHDFIRLSKEYNIL